MACCNECTDKLLAIHVGYDPQQAIAHASAAQARHLGAYRRARAVHVGFDAGAAAEAGAQAAGETKEGKSLGGKIAAVGEDAAAGAAIGGALGTVFPVVGNVIGGAVGSAVGAIYGAIDQFGGDVADAFNPPVFNEDQYTGMKRKCEASGGAVVYGVPPDQYGACKYPDVFNLGRPILSGGDWPSPGTWNLGHEYGEIKDQVVYDRYKGPTCEGPLGVQIPIPPGWGCQPGLGPVPPPPPPGPPPPPKPPLFANPRALAGLLKTLPPKTSPPAPLKVLTLPLPKVATTLANAVLAAKNGDVNAKAGIAKVVAKAEEAPASFASQIAFGLDDANKRSTRAKYVFYWLFGNGAAQHFKNAA
jgi:hypothetical protein